MDERFPAIKACAAILLSTAALLFLLVFLILDYILNILILYLFFHIFRMFGDKFDLIFFLEF